MYHTQANTPVPTDRWDQATLNMNLPHGNDVWPAIQVPPRLDPNYATRVVAGFRKAAQDRVGYTPLHTLAYNLLSASYFNNQMMLEWCQRAVDFAEFLIVAQNNTPDVAVDKAVTKIYVGMLAVVGGQYPHVAQQLPPDLLGKLKYAGDELQSIYQDLQAFHASGRQAAVQPIMPAYGTGYATGYSTPGMLPPITTVAPRPSIVNQVHNAAPAGYSYTPAPQPAPVMTSTTGSSLAGGRYVNAITEPARPVNSWTAGTTTTATEKKPMYNNTSSIEPITPIKPAAADLRSDLPIPTSLEDLVIDPRHYVPPETTIDPKRPYDVIFNPGGVEIRPAHLAKGWKRTKGHQQPYRMTYDPENFMLFLVKWPDGVIQEKLVELTPEMDYLKHETNEALRAAKFRPTGKVVASFYRVIDNSHQSAKPVAEVKSEMDADMRTVRELSPVILDENLTASTDVENEVMARNLVTRELGLDANIKEVPAHEYPSVRMYPLEITGDGKDTLYKLSKATDLNAVANGLKGLLDNGDLSLRSYELINQRLTLGMNRMLADQLGMENLNIDSFADDIDDLMDYIAKKYEPELTDVIKGNAENFVSKWMTIVDEESDEGEDTTGLAEMYVNFQVGWTSDQLGSLNLSDEPVLVSSVSHPRIRKVLQAFMGRNAKIGRLKTHHLRIITVDGVYLEVLNGLLVQNSILLKKL